MQNSSLFQPGTDFLLLFPLALLSPPPGEKPRHSRLGAAATGRPSESKEKVSFWECGTGAGLVYFSEQWVSGCGGRCQTRGGRERAGEGQREGAEARHRALLTQTASLGAVSTRQGSAAKRFLWELLGGN